jgi:hypothetical protein
MAKASSRRGGAHVWAAVTACGRPAYCRRWPLPHGSAVGYFAGFCLLACATPPAWERVRMGPGARLTAHDRRKAP